MQGYSCDAWLGSFPHKSDTNQGSERDCATATGTVSTKGTEASLNVNQGDLLLNVSDHAIKITLDRGNDKRGGQRISAVISDVQACRQQEECSFVAPEFLGFS